jgi:acyl-coenzyme A synthetase/AMP-(fatty) acid ligase
MLPETRYAKSGDVNIAYQVLGKGPPDLVLVPGWVSNIDVCWEEPAFNRFLTRLASFTRLILFDKRGTGLSDRVADMPSLEVRMDDVRDVMDAVRSERAALIIYTSGTAGKPKGALHAHRTLLGHRPGVEMSHNLLPRQDDLMWTPADWAWIGGLLDLLFAAMLWPLCTSNTASILYSSA